MMTFTDEELFKAARVARLVDMYNDQIKDTQMEFVIHLRSFAMNIITDYLESLERDD